MITVGRSLENNIVYTHRSISGKHAEVEYISFKEIRLKDIGSANGTFVKKKDSIRENRIQIDTITIQDELRLGNYSVNIQDFFKKIRTIANKNQTDFSEEFKEMRPIFLEYEKKKKKLSEPNKTGIYIRIILLTIAYGASYIMDMPPKYRSFSALLGTLAVMAPQLLSNRTKKQKALQQLDEEYKKKLTCPKCNNPLHSKFLSTYEKSQTCSNSRCDAKFF